MGLLSAIRKDSVIFRFSLYGFLKNQQYYDPFWILAFLDKGLSFLAIGLLISVREVTMNLLEVPSGAIADVMGRRAAMVFSFVAYITAFVLFGFANDVAMLALGMVAFGVGEAFRTGTHKSMIFAYLRHHGRLEQKTKIYGYTRSWSKFGSAVSVLIGAGVVLASGSLVAIFFLSALPYLANIVNVLGYPSEVDGERSNGRPLSEIFRILVSTMRDSFRVPALRRVLLESMGFEGVFKAVKDYVQPVIQAIAVASLGGLALLNGMGDEQRVAMVVAPVYFAMFIFGGVASRYSHKFSVRHGGHVAASRVIWAYQTMLFLVMLPALYYGLLGVAVAAFVVLHTLQNLWGPLMYSRLDDNSREEQGATLLSIESQVSSLAAMVLAPALGWSVDLVAEHGLGGSYWPVGALGLLVALVFFATGRSAPGGRVGAA